MTTLDSTPQTLTAFAAFSRITSGPRAQVLAQLRAQAADPNVLIRIFDDATGGRLDFDLRPEAADTSNQPEAPTRSVGRPKLGVVAREVTLLPRHWEWLNRQPGGASVALRRLVEDARRATQGRDAARLARESAYRFMTEMAGDLAGFEEATRALFAAEGERFASLIALWPQDVRDYLQTLAASSWQATEAAQDGASHE
ncbi:MAG: DUF2239 family protein [Pseudomonadota bacterium]